MFRQSTTTSDGRNCSALLWVARAVLLLTIAAPIDFARAQSFRRSGNRSERQLASHRENHRKLQSQFVASLEKLARYCDEKRLAKPAAELRRLAEDVGLAVERLEKLDLYCHFDSIQKFIDVQISCAGRTDENGQLALGIVDLEDEQWLGSIEAISKDAHNALSAYVSDGGFKAPFSSDEISARA